MSTASKAATLARELEAICGAENVVAEESVLVSHAIDAVTPQAVVSPANAEETAAVLKFTAERGLVVVPAGSFSRQHIGRVPERVDIVLQTTRMNAINYFEPGDLTIGIQAGAKLSDVLAHVEAHGETLPIDPPAAARATIGGIVATCASGPLRHGYGTVRDFCLGVQFATAAGKVAKAGGRVVKNVAGYDVTKLLVGSYGTLAVITAANFRVFPRLRQTRTFIAQFKTLDDAIHARDQVVLASPLTPIALELLSPEASRSVMPRVAQGAWALLLRAGGSDAVLGRYRHELGTMVSADVDGADEANLWTAVADFPDTLFAREARAIVLRVSVPQKMLPVVLGSSDHFATSTGLTFAAAGRAVSPMSLAFVPPAGYFDYNEILRTVRQAVGADGAVVVTHCPTEMKRTVSVWGTTATDFDAIRSVKRTFDSGDILNRGRFLL